MSEAPARVPTVVDSEPDRIVHLRHPWRWVSAAVLCIIAGLVLVSVATNERYQWDVVAKYFLSSDILKGVWLTIWLTFVTMVLGLMLGTLLAVMRLSANPVLVAVSATYIWLFRGTPLLVQLLFWYNIASLYPTISIGIPFGPELLSLDSNVLIGAFSAALLGLALNEGAYISEIIRGGILSVHHGQTEAAKSLGMSNGKTLRHIILPQAMRVILPPLGNETIALLKLTSLVSVIALPELLYSAQIIYSKTYETIPLLIVASLWYLILVSVLSIGQHFLERHFGRGARRSGDRGRNRSVLKRLVGRPIT